MSVFRISDDKIKIFRQKYLFLIITVIVITLIVSQAAIYYTMPDINIFLITLGISVITVLLLIFFLIKMISKSIENSAKGVQYIIEDGRLIVKQGDFEQLNASKDEIKCINKYKNNLIIVILNNNKKFIVNKFLENHDELLSELKQLMEITEIDKNPYFFQNIAAVIIAIPVMGIFSLSKNLLLVIISSVLLFSFCLYLFFVHLKDIYIDPKKKKIKYLVIPALLFIILSRILELLEIL